jgi:hypothetical protein
VEDRWGKLEEIVRRVVKEEIAALGKKSKLKLELVNGRWVGISEEQMSAWSEAFPGVEIDAELKKMAAWVVSNPMMAPKSQLGRFVNSWLTKTQNQASLRSIPTVRPAEIKQKHCAYCPAIADGSMDGIWYCSAHRDDAYERKPRRHMLGVVAKPVAGND